MGGMGGLRRLVDMGCCAGGDRQWWGDFVSDSSDDESGPHPNDEVGEDEAWANFILGPPAE